MSRGAYHSASDLRTIYHRELREFSQMPSDKLALLGEMGGNNDHLLTSIEADYLNEIFKNDSLDFDFQGKRVWFRHGKEAFFREEENRLNNGQAPIRSAYLYVFTEDESRDAGGIDAAIDYWCVFLYSFDKMLTFVKNSQY